MEQPAPAVATPNPAGTPGGPGGGLDPATLKREMDAYQAAGATLAQDHGGREQ